MYSAVKTSVSVMDSHLYLLSLNTTGLKPDQYEAQTAIGNALSGRAEILHRFKVTGEEKLLLVVQEWQLKGTDSLIVERFPVGLSVSSCTPVIPIESCVEKLQVSIPEGSPVPLDNGRLIWFEVNIGSQGKTLEDLMTAWREEAVFALTAQRQIPAKMYKVVGERKVTVFVGGGKPKLNQGVEHREVTDIFLTHPVEEAHAFLGVPPKQADSMSFDLPLVKHLGDSIQIRTKGVYRY